MPTIERRVDHSGEPALSREDWFRETLGCCQQAKTDVLRIQSYVTSLDSDISRYLPVIN